MQDLTSTRPEWLEESLESTADEPPVCARPAPPEVCNSGGVSIGQGPACDDDSPWGNARLDEAAIRIPDAYLMSQRAYAQRRIYDAHRQSAHQNRPLKEIKASDPRHRQARWDRENMTTVGTRLTRKDDAEFTQLCALLGTTRSHVIKVAVFDWINKRRHLLPQEEYDPETEVWHP